MAQIIDNISTIASNYDVIVLDQYGVLHDGKDPYANAIECLNNLTKNGTRLAVLSNSGKRSDTNTARIVSMGFAPSLFEFVMTSGEAMWQDILNGTIVEQHFFSIESNSGDAINWAKGLNIKFENSVKTAEAILLMGIPDDHSTLQLQDILDQAFTKNLPIYCSNPDLFSPRAGGQIVVSPGTLAHSYRKRGGKVIFYGKPHKPIFDGLKKELNANRLLMVGDSLDHDIVGGHTAGWDTLLIQSGIYASDFINNNHDAVLNRLIANNGCKSPKYLIESLK